MQPLDICVYGPFLLTADAYLQSFTPSNIIKGFNRSGIWPINRLVFTADDFLGAEATDRPDPTLLELPDCERSRDDSSLFNLNEEKVSNSRNADQENASCFIKADLAGIGSNSSESCNIVTPILEEILASVMKMLRTLRDPKAILQHIKPYPKAGPRKKMRTRAGSSRIITSSAEKKRIESLELDKKKKEATQKAKRQVFPATSKLKNTRRPKSQKIYTSESSDSEIDLPKNRYSSDSNFEFEFDENEDLQTLLDDQNINIDDYLLVKFPTKKDIKYYVGIVTGLDGDEYEVKFLRRKESYGFHFPDLDDIATVLRIDVVSKLPQPSNFKATSRLSSFVKFDVNFGNLNVQ